MNNKVFTYLNSSETTRENSYYLWRSTPKTVTITRDIAESYSYAMILSPHWELQNPRCMQILDVDLALPIIWHYSTHF